MRIVIDGMGGDDAPATVVEGAVEAAGLIEDTIYIVGRQDEINEELRKNSYEGDNIVVVNADEVITMEDSPVKSIRRKTDSSMVVCLNMLKDGDADVMISGGNTGALIVGSRMILGRIEGIDRPVLASVYPCIGGTDASLLLDAGASSEAKAHNLVEYGLMGSIYMEKVLGRENPRVRTGESGRRRRQGHRSYKGSLSETEKRTCEFCRKRRGKRDT